MPNIPWDLEKPPIDPPDGADPLIWRLSSQLRTDHDQIDVDGFCAVCRAFSPCGSRRLAERGLILAWRRHKPPPNAASTRYDRSSTRTNAGKLGTELYSALHAPVKAAPEARLSQEHGDETPAPPIPGVDRIDSQQNDDNADR